MPATSIELAPVKFPDLESLERIEHGFFTRPGGVSKGIYKGLNVGLGSDDNKDDIEENRKRVVNYFSVPVHNLVTPFQVHSADPLIIDKPFEGARPKADAVVTKTPGLIAGILTADCGPVLFADPNAGVVASAHAGWQGATGGILENTVNAMESLGAARNNITAILGPTISQKHYEVGPEFVERLITMDKKNERWLIPSGKKDHAMFDLPGYIVNRLQNFGVTAQWTGHCTYADENLFYSYRRKTHRNEPDYGRQLSAICII